MTLDAIKKWLTEKTTIAGILFALAVIGDAVASEEWASGNWWGVAVSALLMVLRGRGKSSSKLPGSSLNCLMWAIPIPAAAMLLLADSGCAQNQEPSPRMTQTTTGPSTPQRQTIEVRPWIDMQHVYICATQPGGDGSGYASAATGRGRGSGGGFVMNIPIWVDASSTSSPRAGDMRPSTGDQSADTDGELSPRTQVNPALGFGMPGSAVTASSSGTAAFDGATATGAPNTVSPTQTPNYMNLRVPTQYLQQLQALFPELFNGFLGPAATGLPATRPAGP
jgi:hypothetical protein